VASAGCGEPDGSRLLAPTFAGRQVGKIALLTGGKDPHYVGGLVSALAAREIEVAVVGGDEIAAHDGSALTEIHNFVGPQDPSDGLAAKVLRVLAYYARLVRFAARTDARLFHVLWFRKFPILERTLLIGYFKLLRKRLVFTAHNVDDEVRDGRRRTRRGRVSLRLLYGLVDHVLVHTEAMKRELAEEFGLSDTKVTVVPLGINNVIPTSRESRAEAREALRLHPDAKVMLFFGNIAPYKGLEDLVSALDTVAREDDAVRLVIAGPIRDKSSEQYWQSVEQLIRELRLEGRVDKTIGYIPDAGVGQYFCAADVVILPYRRIYQSGVLPLAYAQGRPVIVANAGSLPADVIDGQTGFVYEAGDVSGLAATIREYFSSPLFHELEGRRARIRDHGLERFSWKANVERTCAIYERLLGDETAGAWARESRDAV